MTLLYSVAFLWTVDVSSDFCDLVYSDLPYRARDCNLSKKGFEALTAAFSSKSSNLRGLKVSGNAMHGSGIQILSEGFKSPHCKLEILE